MRARHRLFLLSVLLASQGAWVVRADPKAGSPENCVRVSVMRCGDIEVPALSHMDPVEAVSRPVEVGNSRRGPSFFLSPGAEAVLLDAPDGKPAVVLPGAKPGSSFLVIFHAVPGGGVKHSVFSDSVVAHPPGTLRTINLRPLPAVFAAGGERIVVPPGGSAFSNTQPDESGSIPLVLGAQREGQSPYVAPKKSLPEPLPNERILVVVADDAVNEAAAGTPPAWFYYPRVWRMVEALDDTFPGFSRVAETRASESPQRPERECGISFLNLGKPGDIAIAFGAEKIEVKDSGRDFVNQRFGLPGNPAIQVMVGGMPVGSLRMGQASTHQLAVLYPGPDYSTTLASYDNSPQSHPAGSARIFNLTPYPAACSVNGQVIHVGPKGDAILPNPAGRAMELKVGIKTEAGWKLVPGGLQAKPGERTCLYVFDDRASGGIKLIEKMP